MNEVDGRAGGCHCGAIRYVYRTALPAGQWSVRRCTCGYCLKFAACYTSAADAALEVTLLDETIPAGYEFGTGTAQFVRCRLCGVLVFARCHADGRTRAVLNVNTLDEIASIELQTADADFDDEDLDARLDRRRRNWIPHVDIAFAPTRNEESET